MPPTWQGTLTVPYNQKAQVSEDDARLDIKIVQLFDDVREGWQVLAALPDEVAAALRERYRRGELDRATVCELRNRYRHFLPDRADASLLPAKPL